MHRAARTGMKSVADAYAALENDDFTPPTTTTTAPRTTAKAPAKTSTATKKSVSSSVPKPSGKPPGNKTKIISGTSSTSSTSTTSTSRPAPKQQTSSTTAATAASSSKPNINNNNDNNDDDDPEDDEGMLRDMSSSLNENLKSHAILQDDAAPITQDEQQKILKEVQDLKVSLKKENKKFEQPGWNKKEREDYDWVRLSDYNKKYHYFQYLVNQIINHL